MKKGYDIFYAKPGEVETMHCAVCDSKCDKNENVYGAASFGAAVGRIYKYYDVFACPHADEQWHKQALNLITEIEDTPSKRIAELMRQDLEDLLKANATNE